MFYNNAFLYTPPASITTSHLASWLVTGLHILFPIFLLTGPAPQATALAHLPNTNPVWAEDIGTEMTSPPGPPHLPSEDRAGLKSKIRLASPALCPGPARQPQPHLAALFHHRASQVDTGLLYIGNRRPPGCHQLGTRGRPQHHNQAAAKPKNLKGATKWNFRPPHFAVACVMRGASVMELDGSLCGC